MRAYLAFALASLLVACNATGTAAGATEALDSTTLPEHADLSAPPPASLLFAPGWSESVSGTIYAGGALRVEVSPDRFPGCGVSGSVTVSALLEDGSVLEARLEPQTAGWDAGWAAGSLTLPRDTDAIQLWLRSERSDGCVEYDSDLGHNYRFAVHAWEPTTIHFNADWSYEAEGPLVSGGVLVVDYDMARLPSCRGRYRGIPTWDVLAHLRFDSGEEMTQSVADWDEPQGIRRSAGPGLAVFPIPGGARHVELWFENSEWSPGYPLPSGCPAWDSDFGRNYPFDIEAPVSPVGWAGDFNFVMFHRPPATNLGDVDPVYYFDRYAGSETSTWVEAQVWVPGVTDALYASSHDAAQAASDRIQARAVTDALAGEVDGRGTYNLRFLRQQGHNFVYAFEFWKLRYGIYVDSPVAAGLYHYDLQFSTDHGVTWASAGDEAGARRFVVGPALDCALFPDHAPSGCP